MPMPVNIVPESQNYIDTEEMTPMMGSAFSSNETDFYQTHHLNATDDLFHDLPTEVTLFATACCLLFILVGIPGNLLTIIALARCKKVRNATAYFIINLSLCDLMFCCFNLPLAASMFWNRKWIHSQTLCVLFPFFRYGLMAVSIFTVLAITINRYVMIGHPRLYPRMYRTRYLGLMILIIWLGSFGAIVPTLVGFWGKFDLDPNIGSCTIIKDSKERSPKTFLFVMAFLVPCVAIMICYARIFFIVRQATVNSRPVELGASLGSGNVINPSPDRVCSADEAMLRKPSDCRPSMAVIHQRGKMTAKDKKLLWMILVIFGTFVLCYLPITVVKSLTKEQKSSVGSIFGYVLIYLTTCMNPLIYVVMSSEYRQAYKSILSCSKDRGSGSRSFGYGHSFNNATSQIAREQRSSYLSSSQKRSSAPTDSTDISVQRFSEELY